MNLSELLNVLLAMSRLIFLFQEKKKARRSNGEQSDTS